MAPCVRLDAVSNLSSAGPSVEGRRFFVVASAYVKKGDKGRAFSWLKAAIKGGFTDRKMIEENFATLRDDPVYSSLIRRLS